MELSQTIKIKAHDLGFDLVGITSADPIDPGHIQAFADWIEKGHIADLKYMRKNPEKRCDPSQLLDGAQSVICVALHYKPPRLSAVQNSAKIANFALYEEYHPFIKERLFCLGKFIRSLLPVDFAWRFKVCVDTAPLAERALAARAGLGFIGKNHMLIHPTLGSQLLLGELVTTLILPPDQHIKTPGCQNCRLCIQACPTGALREDGIFETSRCISYLTQYAPDMSRWAKAIDNRLFGCDTCLLACPYERQAHPRENPEFRFFPERTRIDPADILKWNEHQFKEQFKNSCIQGIGLEKLKENARICADNTGKTETSPLDEK